MPHIKHQTSLFPHKTSAIENLQYLGDVSKYLLKLPMIQFLSNANKQQHLNFRYSIWFYTYQSFKFEQHQRVSFLMPDYFHKKPMKIISFSIQHTQQCITSQAQIHFSQQKEALLPIMENFHLRKVVACSTQILLDVPKFSYILCSLDI